MSPRVDTFGADARTAPRHLLFGAVTASRFERTDRANATRMRPPWSATCTGLSSWSGARRTENPRVSYAARALLPTRDSSPRKLLTDHDHVALTHGYQTDHRRCCSGPAAEPIANASREATM